MKKGGFTLAELIITFGIIGVVLAMTLPTIMYQSNITSQTHQTVQTQKHDTEVYNVGY